MNPSNRTRNAYGRLRAFFPALLVAFALLLTTAACSNSEKTKSEHLNRGEAYLKDKKFQEASLEFRNAIQIDENSPRGHWGLARAYEGQQRFTEMIDELKRTIALDANNLDARAKLGNYYLLGAKQSGESLAEAERLANEILQKNQNYIEGHILMAGVLFAQGKRDESLARLNHAIELDPKRVESYLSLARFYTQINDLAKADDTFKRAIGVNNASSLAHTEYGRFLAVLKRLDAAEAEFKKAIEVDPTNGAPRRVLAEFYRFITKQNDKAEEAYKAFADLDKENPDGRALLADFYASTGRYDDAANVYQSIIAKSPDYSRARYGLSEVLLQRGDTNGAIAQVNEILKKDDHDRQALLLRARVNSQGTDPKGVEKAIEDLKEVLKQEPTSKLGLYFISDAYLRSGQLEQARTYAAELERNYPDYLPAKLMQVQVSLAGDDPKQSVRLASDLIDRLGKASPDAETSPQLLAELRAKALTARGSAQLRLGNPQGARQDLAAARDLAPNAPGSYVNLAAVAMVENKADEASSLYERALAIDNTNFDALNGLINVYAKQNRLDQAHARLDQVISNGQQNNAALHFLKGQIYGIQKNAQGAETELRKTIELDGNYLPAYSSLAALFVNTNKQEQAIAEYRRLLEKSPNNATIYTLIGMLEDSRQNRDEAIKNYRKTLELDPNSTFAANNLAWDYAAYDKGNLDEAMRLAQGNVQKFPGVSGFVDTLGWVYYKKNLHTAAVEQLQKAVNLDATNAQKTKSTPSPVYRYHLGMALAGKGDKAAARREIEQALVLAKDKPFAEADDARRALTTL